MKISAEDVQKIYKHLYIYHLMPDLFENIDVDNLNEQIK